MQASKILSSQEEESQIDQTFACLNDFIPSSQGVGGGQGVHAQHHIDDLDANESNNLADDTRSPETSDPSSFVEDTQFVAIEIDQAPEDNTNADHLPVDRCIIHATGSDAPPAQLLAFSPLSRPITHVDTDDLAEGFQYGPVNKHRPGQYNRPPKGPENKAFNSVLVAASMRSALYSAPQTDLAG